MTSAANRPHARPHGRRPLRVAPAWVGGARPGAGDPPLEHGIVPVREAVWIWSVRRFARTALWALPLAALTYGWTTIGAPDAFTALLGRVAAAWLALIAMVAVTALLAGSRGRRPAIAGMLLGIGGTVLLLPVTALDAAAVPDPRLTTLGVAAAITTGTGWLLLGWGVLRSGLLNPADGILLMLAAVSVAVGTYAVDPLPTVGALVLLAAGMGLAWTGNRLIPPA
jgi:Amt family ammonium transporter